MKNIANTNQFSTPTNTSTVQKTMFNHLLATACLLLFIALPAASLWNLLTMPPQLALSKLGIASSAAYPAFSISTWQQALAIFLGMLPVTCIAFGLFLARRVFLGFAAGEYFSALTIKRLRGFAAGIFASACAGLIVTPLIAIILTLNAPPGTHALAISLSSQELLTILFGGIVWQIANVMAKAVALAEENAQFI